MRSSRGSWLHGNSQVLVGKWHLQLNAAGLPCQCVLVKYAQCHPVCRFIVIQIKTNQNIAELWERRDSGRKHCKLAQWQAFSAVPKHAHPGFERNRWKDSKLCANCYSQRGANEWEQQILKKASQKCHVLGLPINNAHMRSPHSEPTCKPTCKSQNKNKSMQQILMNKSIHI